MKTFVKKIGAVLLSSVMAVTSLALPSVTALAGASPISTLDSSNVKLTFAAWGDSQISDTLADISGNRKVYLANASNDLRNSAAAVDALVIAGDIAESQNKSEYDVVYNNLSTTGVKNFILAEGNHDIRFNSYSSSKKQFTSFTNKLNSAAGSKLSIDKLYYSYSVKGYKFVVLGSEKQAAEESYISDTQLKWLDSQLAASSKSGKPTFVVMHQVLKNTHGLPTTWGSGNSATAGTVGAQSDKIQSILNKYKNVILISGHLHTGFGEYTYEKIGNIHSVNLPSITIDNDCGTYNENGIGYMTEVYSDKVVFRARNFNLGEYVPAYDITIKLDKVKQAKFSTETYTYDGKTKKPSVTLYDFNGKKISPKNYTVKYPSGRKAIGAYTVKITFKNACKGWPSTTATFYIAPKSTSLSSLSAGKKKIIVKWKKQTSNTSGYQIQYSTSSKFTNAKEVNVSKSSTSKSISGLSSKKKYYVRVRTYKTVKGTKVYSKWSSAKSVTVK